MTTEPKNELLPCPFCGGEPRTISRNRTTDEHYSGGSEGKIFFISCMCGGLSARAHQYGYTKEAASKAWNTRPTKAVQGDIERLANFILKSDLGHPRCSEQKPNGESAVDAAIAIITELRNKNALTPESEGIAGKVEALRVIPCKKLFNADQASGFYAALDLMSGKITEDKIQEQPSAAALSPPAPCVDVEQLKREVSVLNPYTGEAKTIMGGVGKRYH